MAEKKKYKVKKSGGSSSGKSTSAQKPRKKTEERTQNKQNTGEETLISQLVPYIIGAIALFIAVCFVATKFTGIVGKLLRKLLNGLFGTGAFCIPILLIILAVFWRKKKKSGTLVGLIVSESIFAVMFFTMMHIWTKGALASYSLKGLWNDGVSKTGGGVIGGTIGFLFHKLLGSVGIHIVGLSVLAVSAFYIFGLTPHAVYIRIAYAIHEKRERNRERSNEQAAVKPASRRKPLPEPEEKNDYARVKRDPVDRHRFSPDVDMDKEDIYEDGKDEFSERHVVIDDIGGDDGDNADDEDIAEKETEDEIDVSVQDDDGTPPFDIPGLEGVKIPPYKPLGRRSNSLPELSDEPETEKKVDLNSIFVDSDGVDVLQRFADEQKRKALEKSRDTAGTEAEIDILRETLVKDAVPITEEIKKEYEFPPISLLKLDTSPKNVDISDELHTNATKLVETLRSFKVRTRVVNVSRGPTITRYELAPEEGVRVRSIANLVDDIALNLATSGVRIEAPIPGKAAVGVEVPNKTVSTVFLRDLIDTESFRKATSRLNVSLGVDVAGDPIYLDIAKMPHLLIAGATGMGKSVCINSLIISLLYKATSDEVKLILIDPKKVEFALYSGLPHLLVPVVSDPKKAAGSLQWAVTEMERRFELIEDAGVRDLKGYNNVTKDDPDREFLPQIVIVIDELADLMMTASSDVETSICRLAQKARAAGMHLVIGTQRPSVDVITGLIKANVPSRIAFTVSSGTDSKVILDMGGAEKLIGRGDMLYAPVGASKPIRVQGAFVSDSEVENIVSFIKEHNGGETKYSSEIIESIDRAAAACGNGKKNGGGISTEGCETMDEGDPMLRPAIELALESGKISTSLIQRRLSLGYGRAAKLIDEMQIRGIVSPPEGQKPRTVLITKEQYMEMILDRSEDF